MSIKSTGLTALAAIAAAFTLNACDRDATPTPADRGATPATAPATPAAPPPLELVFFEGHNCIYSRATKPVVQEFAAANPGRVHVTYVNVDDHPELFDDYNITATPTMMFMEPDGRANIVHREAGAAVDQYYLESIISRAEADRSKPSELMTVIAEQRQQRQTAAAQTRTPTNH